MCANKCTKYLFSKNYLSEREKFWDLSLFVPKLLGLSVFGEEIINA